jgi:hypothetical protein
MQGFFSFQNVNLHPHNCVPIDECLKHIDSKLQTCKSFFKELNNELFNAMPAVWRNLPLKHCHKVVSIFDEFIAFTPTGDSAWCSQNVWKLLRSCPLDDVPNLRASYMMSQIDPGVIVGTDSSKDPEALEAAAAKKAKMLEPLTWQQCYQSLYWINTRIIISMCRFRQSFLITQQILFLVTTGKHIEPICYHHLTLISPLQMFKKVC